MSIYVLDTSSIRVFSGYYPTRFRAFWKNLEQIVTEERIVSAREVYNELDRQSTKQHVDDWANANKHLFPHPTGAEMAFVARIFQVKHFQQLVSIKQQTLGRPVADPFIIASAHERGAWVVTEESKKVNAGNIPNVCDHFEIDCINLEGFMEREDWSF